MTTVIRWGRRRLVACKRGPRGRVFGLASLERQTRAHWTGIRFKRLTPPAWLRPEAA